MKIWQCSVCKYIHRGDTPPEKCPVCGVDASKFNEISEADIPKRSPARKPVSDPLASAAVKPDAPLSKPGPPPKKQPATTVEKLNAQLLRHHIHPVSVHTPNGLLPVVVLLWILSWLLDYELFAKAAMINQVVVVLSFPVVIYTGALEWKTKYNGALTSIFKLKILAAALTAGTCVLTLIWYLINPLILSTSKGWVFIFLNIFMLLCAGGAGYIGGKLVFKD